MFLNNLLLGAIIALSLYCQIKALSKINRCSYKYVWPFIFTILISAASVFILNKNIKLYGILGCVVCIVSISRSLFSKTPNKIKNQDHADQELTDKLPGPIYIICLCIFTFLFWAPLTGLSVFLLAFPFDDKIKN